ncbi:MAG: response regulator transcription factor [Bacteroidales bacterium]|jgi:DNA-binding response OmpR family regulator|nr:response regulator transcription factor [Bacteroidales bacterium]
MTNTEQLSILLVEDDPNLRLILQDFLELMQYKTHTASDGLAGLAVFRNHTIHLCILDVMLPKMDGFALAQEIRKHSPNIPIIFLTAKSQKEDRLMGFQLGCDDYITKPFSTDELHLRIKAVMRRCIKQLQEDEKFQLGKFRFDSKNLLLHSDFGDQKLTRKEAALLKLLCTHKNQVLTRDEALHSIWGDNDYFIGRSMDVFIVKLRKYLREDPDVSITNVHGVGFKLEVKD